MTNPFASPFSKAFSKVWLSDSDGEYTPTLPPLSAVVSIGKGGVTPWNSNVITGYTRAESRTLLVIGQQNVDEIQVEYWNGWIANGEQSNTNSVTYEAFLEGVDVATGVVQRFLFSASNTATAAGGAYVTSDVLLASAFGLDFFPAGSKWRIQTGAVPAVGLKIPVTSTLHIANLPSEKYGVLSTGGSNLGSAGDLTVPVGGIESTNVCTPTMVLGKCRGDIPMVILQMGDSVDVGSNDDQDTGTGDTGGWFAIGTRNAGGMGQISMTRIGRSGEQVRYYANATKTYRRRMLSFHNTLVNGFGGADGLAGRTYAQVVADLENLFTDARTYLQGPGRIIQRLIQPYTTSSDGWTTPTGQTAGSGGEPGGSRDQINAYFAAEVGNHLDLIFNPNQWWQNQTVSPDYHWCWANGRAGDSSHPNGTAHAEAGAGFATFIAAVINGTGQSYSITAALAGTGAVSATVSARRGITATMAGTAAMTAAVGKASPNSINATMAGTSAMTAAIGANKPIAATMAGTGAIATTVYARRPIAATMAGTGAITGVIGSNKPILATLAGTGAITAAVGLTPGGGFAPNSLTGFLSWLDAANNVTHASNVITVWGDRYGGSYDATQNGTSTLRPTYSTFNGIPIVNFDGGDYMQWNLPSNFHATGKAFTIVLVYRKTNLGFGNQYVYGYNETGTGFYGGMGVGNDGTHKWSVGGNGSQTALVAGGGNSNLHFLTTRCTIGSQIRGSLDGGTEQVGTGNFSAIATTANFQLGRESKTPGSYFTGGIVGALAYESYLSSTDLNTLCNYLETYYNPSSGDAVWSDVS